MGERIPEETIEKVRSSLDIVDVIGEYLQLKKHGRNYFGLCPFHGEKTPSFSVSADKQIYRCFGCGAGGNVFSFMMDIEGFTFLEAFKHLANKANVDIGEVVDLDKHSGPSKQAQAMIDAHEVLQKLYHHLLTHTEEGQVAYQYLLNRGFTDEAIKKFKLGFAPDSWNMVTRFLHKRGYSLEEIANAGILGERKSDGQYFDRFRNRIMFPIWDYQGRTIAFGGRTLGDQNPKYLNSPETRIFNKSKTLYGLHLARSEMRKKQEVILFEGYVDVISAWKAGVENGIATLGTSLTEEQASIIRRNVESVIICYDSDKAGINATLRATQILSKAGCYIKIARMPDGMDPDDYIVKYGAKKFKEDVLGASQTVMAFKMDFLRRGKNLQNEGERIRYIEEVLQEISKLSKAIERDHYLRQLSEEFSISLDALKEQQGQFSRQINKNVDNHHSNRNNKPRYIVPQKKKLLPAYHNAERFLLAHMLMDKEVAERVQEEIGVSFNIEEHNAIAAHLYAYFEEGNNPNVSNFMERIADSQLRGIISDLALININGYLSEKELQDYMNQVLKYPKWLKLKEIEQEKKEAERQNDYKKAAQIAMRMIEMRKELEGS